VLRPKASFALLFGLLISLALTACGSSDEPARAGEPRALVTTPSLKPGFSWKQHDYVLRCEGENVTVDVDTPSGWSATVGDSRSRSGSFSVNWAARVNRSLRVRFTKAGEPARNFHIRCLPKDFPPYRFERYRPGGPRLIMVELERYAVAFDRGGVPVWWYYATGNVNNARFMGDGTFTYAPVNGIYSRDFMVHRLDGKLVRKLEAVGNVVTDVHDLIRLRNGNYMLGAHRYVKGVDTRKFGGPASARLDTAQVQEITPSGRLVWKWDAWPRVKLAETGRWWDQVIEMGQPFDVHHWNSVDRRGNRVLLSFRHLDAVLEINRRTGNVRWKLGGTRTAESLKVLKDPRARQPLGGQHDARYKRDGTITLLDNATGLEIQRPRALRYRVSPSRRTATMLKQVTDPEVDFSLGFASANLFPNGEWLVGWGAIGRDGIIGGYTADGKPTFRLTTPYRVSYRANPVTTGSPTIPQLRRAMNRMANRES
jgi:hypothetical protein